MQFNFVLQSGYQSERELLRWNFLSCNISKHEQLKFLISSNRKGRLVSTGGPVFLSTVKVHTINQSGKKIIHIHIINPQPGSHVPFCK